MAQFNHRVNLTKGNFPLLTSELGRTVLVSNNRNTPTGEDENKPSVLYMHNVMPTRRGLQSIGFKEVIPAGTVDPTRRFLEILKVESVENPVASGIFNSSKPALVAYVDTGTGMKFYTKIFNDDFWTETPVFGHASLEPTIANMQDKSYVLATFSSPYTVEDTAGTMNAAAFIGSPFTSLRGITSSFGHLIAWGSITGSILSTFIAWSSLINPLDLTASAVTGAGNGFVEGADGAILYCVPTTTGFLVYCVNNVVAATYTGNKQYPFKFRPVNNSTGLVTSTPSISQIDIHSMVAYGSSSEGHYAFTAIGGLNYITSIVASGVLPEVDDFLSGRLIEDFDEVTKTFSLTSVLAGTNMTKKVRFIANRYLVISYGTALSVVDYIHTHALIYDTQLKRMGKIRLDHHEVFEFSQIRSITSRREPSESIAFVSNDGAVNVISFNPLETTRTGTLILGKFQYVRDRHLVLHKVTAENVESTESFTCTDMVSLDGRNISSLVTGTETSGVGYREYAFKSSGRNHSLAFVGEFIMNTLELLFTIGGRR